MDDKYLKAYKKRNKALQRRVNIEQGINKRLVNLLKQCDNHLNDNSLLKELVKHELEMLKYKYY